MDDGGKFEQHVLLHGVHGGPVLNIRTVTEVKAEVSLAESVVNTALVDAVVKLVTLVGIFVLDIGCGGNYASVGSGSGNGTGVHQRDQRNLPCAGLGALTVGEVAGGVADGETVIGRYVAGTEARTAEGRLDNGACLEQLLGNVVAGCRKVNRSRLRVAARQQVCRP